MTDTPLIWTSKGNLSVSDLVYKTEWEDTPDYIKFSEHYYLEEELVRSSTHVYSKKPLEFAGVQESFG